MTTIPPTSDLTEEEKGKVGLGNPPVLADTSGTVLSGRGLVKTFGRVVGLDGVDVDLFPGEVLAIIGDNGAGKSTLIKALTGALIPDSGQVLSGRQRGSLQNATGCPQCRHRDGLSDPRGCACAGHRGQYVPRSGTEAKWSFGVCPPHARQEGHEGRCRQVDGQPGHRNCAEHEPGR